MGMKLPIGGIVMLSKTISRQVVSAIKPAPTFKLSPMMKAVAKWVQIDPEDRILDMSCGNGEILQCLSQRMDCQISAMTSSVEQFRQVRGNLGNVNVMYAQPEDIPWKDESFDVVMCNTAMIEMIHPEKILKEVIRVLRPGGQFLLTAPCYPKILKGVLEFNKKHENGFFQGFFTKEEMIITLENLGFKNIFFQKEKGWIGVAVGWKPSAIDEDVK